MMFGVFYFTLFYFISHLYWSNGCIIEFAIQIHPSVTLVESNFRKLFINNDAILFLIFNSTVLILHLIYGTAPL